MLEVTENPKTVDTDEIRRTEASSMEDKVLEYWLQVRPYTKITVYM